MNKRSNTLGSQSNSSQVLTVESLEPRYLLSSVTLYAAGVEGDEIMSLQIGGSQVQTWNVGGDAYGGQFQTFEYETVDTITADDVRIEFLNDLFDPQNGTDRNLRVDAIEIDGVRFETEDPSTFSTGTWLPEDGLQAGNRESEFLHANGYFQFSSAGQGGSQLVIRARGDEGGEQFAVLVNGFQVQTFTTTTSFQNYTFNSDSPLDASEIRIEFLNDRYVPAQNIDSNLIVDRIQIDGTIYETEAASVFSTGTWLPSDGIQPGFRLSETLHSNGYFQYTSNVNAGNLRLVTSIYDASEGDGSVRIDVIRENGADGAVSIEYDTVAISAIAGQDFQNRSGTLSWANGESGIKSVFVPIVDDSRIESNEQFGFTIDNPTGDATLLAPRTATITIDDNDSVLAEGDGLLGEYFDAINLTNRFFARTDSTVDFNWGTGAPLSGMGADTFSVRWTGQLEPRFSETYTFQTRSDDGVRLWVNDQLIINQWNDHAATNHTGTIQLEAGVLYDIRMEYYENGGAAVAELSWSSVSQNLEIIPESQLYAAEDPGTPPGDNLQAQTILSGFTRPTSLDWTPDGENMYVTLKDGQVLVVNNGILQTQNFIDLRSIVNDTRDRGLLDIAIHPDFEQNPYVYFLFTYDPPEVNNFSGLAGPDGNGNRAGRLIRVTADAANDYKTAVPGSEVVILGTNSTWNNFNGAINSTNDFNAPPAGINPDGTNVRDFIASDSESHTVGGIEFGIDGNLFVSIGDGTSYNAVDARTVRVQDIDNLSGKILRIDPITGQGVSDNPFYNGDPNSNRSKVYQFGLRNPFRIAVNPDSGQLYIGDVGWTQWEEVNAGDAGANFGWPYYEGGSGASFRTNRYQDLPEAQTFYASGQTVTPAIYALNHSATGINAIILGDVYTGDAYPESYRGDLFFNDLGQGIVRNISFDANGNVTNVETFTTDAQIVVHIQQGPDGNLYFIDLNDGEVGRWVFV